MPLKKGNQPKINFLEMPHINFVSSIRKTQYQLGIWTRIKKPTTCFRHFEVFVPFCLNKCFQLNFLKINSYIDKEYLGSHKNIQINKLEYRTHPKHQNQFASILFFFFFKLACLSIGIRFAQMLRAWRPGKSQDESPTKRTQNKYRLAHKNIQALSQQHKISPS